MPPFHPQGSRRLWKGEAMSDRVRVAGLALCVASVAVEAFAVAIGVSVPFVASLGIVLPNVALFSGLACAAIGLSLLGASRVMHAVGDEAPRRLAARIGRGAATACIVAIAGASSFVGGLLYFMDEPYWAAPTGPFGVRVLVIEHHFLLLSSGDVYYVIPGVPLPVHAGEFSCDDSYSPMRAGTYSLQWVGLSADMSIWSDSSSQGMVPFSATFDWRGAFGSGA